MPPAARRRAWWFAFLALYTLEQALLWWLYWGHGAKTLAGDEVIYSGWARDAPELAPFAQSYLWPPLQAWFLRALDTNVVAVQLVQTALLLGCAGLLRALWLACDGRRRAANLAAALFVLNPSTAAYAQWLWPEVVHLFLMLAAPQQHGEQRPERREKTLGEDRGAGGDAGEKTGDAAYRSLSPKRA